MTSSYRRILSCIGLTALVLLPSPAWAVTENFCSFPASLTTWTYNQNAFEALNSVIRLTDNVAGETGSAFLTAPVPLTATTSFNSYFRFKMGPSNAGGDGLAFVLQNAAAGAAAVGTGGADMGFGGLTPSVVIEFDTYKNVASDPNANNVSLILNGANATHTATANPAFTMAASGMLYAWVDYNGGTQTISVYLAQSSTKPATALLTHAVDLFTQLGAQMYVGFSSATATSPEINEHDVYELDISTNGVPCACEGDSACGGATPACAASGVCAICSATNATGCPVTTPVCDVPVNTCVGCLTNAGCASPTPICDATALACRACAGSADCGGATPECATTGPNSGDCVVCVVDANCPPATPRCSSTNVCVQCLGASDCGGDTPICTGGVCKACSSDSNCSGSTPACEVWGACGQCSSTNATACVGGVDVCDFPTGTCVDCEFNSDCSGSNPTCNSTTHTCGPCATDADCVGNPGGQACVTTGMKAGSCVVCTVDSDCTSPAAPKCDTVANECVECLTSADCSAPNPVCNGAQLCVACATSADCSGATPVCDTTLSACKPCSNDYAATNPGVLACPTAALPACQPGGTPLAGQCAVCSAGNASACVTVAATPVCIAAVATCGCQKDTDCNADSYCDTSTTSTGVCTAGCRVLAVDGGAGGVDNCSTGDFCSTTDGGLGTCTSEPCNSNADCKSPTAVCDTIVQPHVCVQCLNAPDCSNGQVCDTTNHCVACTTKLTNNCKASGSGSTCLASETCGCASDVACGGANSGRVCNATTSTCEPGCRGTGGNGCPASETCSSTDGTVGACKGATMKDAGPPPTKDAGVDGGHDGGGTPLGHVVSESTGCGCRVAGRTEDERSGAIAGLLFGLTLAARRRRSGRGAGRARAAE